MKYEDIKNPIELIEFMNENLKYGFVHNNDIYSMEDAEKMSSSYDLWRLSNPNDLLNKKYGICIDMVEFERRWFKEHNYKFKTIFINMEIEETHLNSFHTCLVFFENGKWNLFEYIDKNNAGVYVFNFINQALLFALNNHIMRNQELFKNGEVELSNMKIIEYQELQDGIDLNEFMDKMYHDSLNLTDAIVTIESEEK